MYVVLYGRVVLGLSCRGTWLVLLMRNDGIDVKYTSAGILPIPVVPTFVHEEYLQYLQVEGTGAVRYGTGIHSVRTCRLIPTVTLFHPR